MIDCVHLHDSLCALTGVFVLSIATGPSEPQVTEV